MSGDDSRQTFRSRSRGRVLRTVLPLALLCLWGGLPATPGHAQPTPRVQALTGYLNPGQREVYGLPNLKAGDTLSVYLQRRSGNLDPLFALADARFDLKAFDVRLAAILQQSPENHFEAFRNLLDSTYLAWDDDSGRGSDAALKFPVPADGDYKLVVAGSRQPVGRDVLGRTFGDYRLLIGINAPQVLTGQAAPTGAIIARLDRPAGSPPQIQEVTGALTPQNNNTYFRLANLAPDTTLYVRVEATSGDLKPALTLRNYGNKALRVDNFGGRENVARLQYTVKEDSRNYSLFIDGRPEGRNKTSGGFRLLVGVNAPEVLEGRGQPWGPPLIREPIKVAVGLRMDQITEVNQRGENFGVVGDLTLAWQDPAFAFNPDTCQCAVKVLESAQFEQFRAQHQLRWPRFIFYNQQGKRWTQDEVFRIYPDGKVTYYERFSATLQAPDFNFKKFPFDTQQFFIRLAGLHPEEEYSFTNLPLLTGVGKQLGEEEWYITKHDVNVGNRMIAEDTWASQFSLRFVAQRHLSYYLFRIFLPLFLIIVVSWVTFFLKDYAKRVDISGANLLVFIAFNFTIGSDLPRLGYLTFLDTVLIVAFVVTILTVVVNVALKRLDTAQKTALAQNIDAYILWGYPLFFAGGFVILAFIFLW